MLTVFISSTSEDLTPYRQAARDVVLDLGWQPVMMEHFGTDGERSILESCIERIEKADIVLAILGWRRGWVPESSRGGDGRKSCTGWEIESAFTQGKPVLVLMARDTWPGRLWESDSEARAWVEDFRRRLDRLAVFFEWEEVIANSTEPLQIFCSKVRQELLRHQQDLISREGQERRESRDVVPEPTYHGEHARYLSEALQGAYGRYDALKISGQDTSGAWEEILSLRRQLREGGQLQAGDMLGEGRFRLFEQIGRGGCATVWKAFDRKLHEWVAVKVLHGHFAADRTWRERFFRGARKMSDLQHQGIVRVIERELEDGGYYFFVMEYVTGGDLQKALLEKEVSSEAALAAIQKVGEALHFAHQRGVVHRDIKPSNILFDERGWPKLTDFDLVRAKDTTGLTRGGMMGTFPYAALEALRAPHEAWVPADVYSLAMTAIFCLHGAELPPDVFFRRTDFVDALPCNSAVKAVLRRATSEDAAGRFDSVASFTSALEVALSSADTVESVVQVRMIDSGDREGDTLFQRIRRARNVKELAENVCRKLKNHLSCDRIAVLVLDERSGFLVDPLNHSERIDVASALAGLAVSAKEPLRIDLAGMSKLPLEDREWLRQSGFKLLFPILTPNGVLFGLLGLGKKRLWAPYFKWDLDRISEVAESMTFWIELNRLREGATAEVSTVEEEDWNQLRPEFAKECAKCGPLYPSYTVFCSRCSYRLDVSLVPYVLPGKFRFERRIGAGGMAVVYRAVDLALGRQVAVKTLRRISPEDAMRLRREARTAAAVSHPYLAGVYGMETWRGTPLLVMELLEGGTLSHRINGVSLPPGETIELGISISAALAQLHAADILHRDLKPSNIGYTRDGVPKLMDFGIARLAFDPREEVDTGLLAEGEDDSVLRPPTAVWNSDSGSRRQFAGTLSYLSPEALNGQPPDASLDLWSLAIVLYECLLGRKIFTGAEPAQLMARIRHGRIPEISQVLPELDGALGDFFRSALHKNPSRRPASADEFRQRLEEVRQRMT